MFLVAMLVATVANAQLTNGTAEGLEIGVEAGLSINNYTSSSRLWREGFYVGARGEYHFSPCYLSASLRLIRKGADAYDGDSDSDDFYEAYYLELPVAVGISGRLGKKPHIFGETGPYIAYGIGGRAKGETYPDGYTISWSNKFFSKANGSPRRFDAGWGIRGGVRFGKVEISAGYEIGFASVWDDDDSCNSSFTLGIAYMF